MNALSDNDSQLLSQPSHFVAPRLLGCILERTTPDGIIKVKITEVEAYDQSDAASHSYRGKTPRTEVMFGPPGHLYVYFTYGMHYCCNIVTGPEGDGSAVLIRSVEPVEGKAIMVANRRGRDGAQLSNGPAKVCQALMIDNAMNGHNLTSHPLRLIIKPPVDSKMITVTPRIGISKAKDTLWRFVLHT